MDFSLVCGHSSKNLGRGGGNTLTSFWFLCSCCIAWLGSLIHVCGEIKIRRLQNENLGSSPARPWYYAGNIKSIPRFRHPSPEKKKYWSIPTGIVLLWLKLDVLVVGMKQSLSLDIHRRPPHPHPCCCCHQTLFLSPSKVRLIYISQTCSFLLRNGFSWSVGAGSLSSRYHPAGTAQPSPQMAVFQRNKNIWIKLHKLIWSLICRKLKVYFHINPHARLLLWLFDAWRWV